MRNIKQPPDIAFQTRRQRPSATHTLRHQEEGAERQSNEASVRERRVHNETVFKIIAPLPAEHKSV